MHQLTPATVAAYLGILTAAIGTWIAWQQHRATRDRLRLDLYDRRYAVFVATNQLISAVVSHATLDIADLHAFNRDTAQAVFLFKEQLLAYIDGVRDRALEFRLTRQQLANLAGTPKAMHQAIVAKDAELLTWFTEQLNVSRKEFAEYLNFDKVL